MIGGNRTRDFAFEDEPKRDAELTLGPWLLTVLGCALLSVCAVCFGAGYALGHRNAARLDADKIPAASAATDAAAAPTSASAKPGARGNSAAVPAPAVTSDATDPVDAQADAAPVASAAPIVRPALPSAESVPAAHAPVANGWMVQIAAVTHQDDADVLTSALRRRGYAVVQRHGTGDTLIHVQVGPFVNRADANAMAQRLQGDGYNAAVQ
jgi:DedD protein